MNKNFILALGFLIFISTFNLSLSMEEPLSDNEQFKKLVNGKYSKENETEAIRLLNQGADPTVGFSNYANILEKIAHTGKWVNLIPVLSQKGFNLDQKYRFASWNYSALEIAFKFYCQEHNDDHQRYLEVIATLIENNTDIYQMNTISGTFLNEVIGNNRLNVLTLLLKKAEDNNDTEYKNLALRAAAQADNTEAIDITLEYGADVNSKNVDRQTALHIAVYFDKFDAAKKIIETDKYKFTSDDKDMFKYLDESQTSAKMKNLLSPYKICATKFSASSSSSPKGKRKHSRSHSSFSIKSLANKKTLYAAFALAGTAVLAYLIYANSGKSDNISLNLKK